jgi:hypothetical protein
MLAKVSSSSRNDLGFLLFNNLKRSFARKGKSLTEPSVYEEEKDFY